MTEAECKIHYHESAGDKEWGANSYIEMSESLASIICKVKSVSKDGGQGDVQFRTHSRVGVAAVTA